MDYETVEEETPKVVKKKDTPKTPRIYTSTPKTVSGLMEKMIESLKDSILPDEKRLYEILIAPRGNKNRNETYQRNNIIKPTLEFLIKKNWIK